MVQHLYQPTEAHSSVMQMKPLQQHQQEALVWTPEMENDTNKQKNIIIILSR